MRLAAIAATSLLLLGGGCDDAGGGSAGGDATSDTSGGDLTVDAPSDAGPRDTSREVDGDVGADSDARTADGSRDADPDAETDGAGPDVRDAGPDGLDDAELPDTADGDAGRDGDIAVDGDAPDGGDLGPPDGGGDTNAGPLCSSDEDCASAGPCRTGFCDMDSGTCASSPAGDGTPCDDGNACSLDATCQSGTCIGAASRVCEDDNPCTDDLCKPAEGCAFTNNFATCDDGDPCTKGDFCDGGTCKAGAPTCEDDNPCTVDSCNPNTGACTHTPDDEADCDDGSPCTRGDRCRDGACLPGEEDGCDDGNPCTAGSCEEGDDDEVCVHEILHGEPCEDGDPCTVDDVCSAGECSPGPPAGCDDEDPCTVDSCDPEVGCVHEDRSGEPCDDGDRCTLEGTCDEAGACVSPGPVDCDDDNPCTFDSCDPETGCTNKPVEADCDDGDACTLGGTCQNGQCVGEPRSCDDGDACTADTCDPKLGCQHVDVSGSCVDEEPCTEDFCDPEVGCVFLPRDEPCDDGDPCTVGDDCSSGTCAGDAVDCDDGDPCTMDACDPEIGCVHQSFVGPCDDGDACTTGESCDAEGICGGGDPVDPDDGIDCTIDTCDPEVGVVHEPDETHCPLWERCSVQVGCELAPVRVVISKVMLRPADAPGARQWFAITNVGEATIDVGELRVVHSGGVLAKLRATSGDPDEVVPLAPGETAAGLDAPPADEAIPAGFRFIYGTPGDAFELSPFGDALRVFRGPAQLVEGFDFFVINDKDQVVSVGLPVLDGVPTTLDAAVLAEADDAADNDTLADWCAAPSQYTGPDAPHAICDRTLIHRVALAGPDGERLVELQLPAGGPLAKLAIHILDPTGERIGEATAPAGRAPLSGRVLLRDGVGGATLPQLTDGAVQLLRGGDLLDVYGFGSLEAEVDAEFGLPLWEGTPGPAQAPGDEAVRAVEGEDTDDNAADFQ